MTDLKGVYMPEGDNDITKEIIAHVNSLEEKLRLLEDKIKEKDDLITVNKLDIINLKNSVEKLRMSLPEVSPETLARLRDMEKVASKMVDLKEMQKQLKAITSSIDPAKVVAGMEQLNKRLESLESMLSVKGKPKMSIRDLHKRIGMIEKKTGIINHCTKCGSILKKGAKFCSICGKPVR